jgi:2-polyprenyl-3-methyl-5-hydroxy-6-metoxy-1,4-benzoquinol methylase
MIKTLEHTTVDDLHRRLLEEIPNGASVIDVGAGLAKYHELLAPPRTSRLTLVDAHEPYLNERAVRFPDAEILCGEAFPSLSSPDLISRRWDVALGIDFIEHLDVGMARATIRAMQRVAHKVILFTPEGNHPQNTDHYGLGGDHWQTHRSTWKAEDFEALGFETERWVDFHRWAQDRGCDPGAIWAIWRRP